ncbi:hypothetical protein PG988_010742 [Apiospora saccharicola]
MSSSPPHVPTVTLSALRAGHLTLPEPLFVTNADPDQPRLRLGRQARARTERTMRLRASAGEDLMLRRILILLYSVMSIGIMLGRRLILRRLLSWWGGGTLEVLREGAGPRYPGELFNSDELPWDRTRDFPPIPGREDDGDGKGAGVRTEGYDERYAPSHTPTPEGSKAKPLPCMVSSPATVEDKEEKGAWKPPASFPHTLDLYGDGSVYVFDAPGHIYGHVNLLVRIRQDKYVCLGGDYCHDPRILAGEKEFAEYPDGQGAGLRSVHTDTAIVRNTLDRIKKFAETGVEIEGRRVEIEVVVAHDGVWAEGNRGRFWPGTF